jgi:hypothetical protein
MGTLLVKGPTLSARTRDPQVSTSAAFFVHGRHRARNRGMASASGDPTMSRPNDVVKLRADGAEVFIPDGSPAESAIARTTHLGICAHQDDLEIMAYHGILECFQQKDKWFTGVTMTNGSGSARDLEYKDYTQIGSMAVRCGSGDAAYRH